MIRVMLIAIVGFFRWILSGCKTSLFEEIFGKSPNNYKTRGDNYLIGLLIFILIIILFILI